MDMKRLTPDEMQRVYESSVNALSRLMQYGMVSVGAQTDLAFSILCWKGACERTLALIASTSQKPEEDIARMLAEITEMTAQFQIIEEKLNGEVQ